MPQNHPQEARLSESWNLNAEAWTQSVREGRIESRRTVTDQAIIDAVTTLHPVRVLDAGCGEGWLARRLAAQGIAVTGFDGSAPLIERAREAGGGHFVVCSYEQFCADPLVVGKDYDAVVFNFALLSEAIAPVLRAAASLLAPGGSVVIQTLHPFNLPEGERYADGWREERFSGMGDGYRAAMPWYYRTMGDWLAQVHAAGLRVADMREPMHPETGRPGSLVLRLEVVQ